MELVHSWPFTTNNVLPFRLVNFFTFRKILVLIYFNTNYIINLNFQDIVTGDAATIIPSYDEITLCNPAFKTLRSMVNTWLLEVSVYKNVFADYQLIHFYR